MTERVFFLDFTREAEVIKNREYLVTVGLLRNYNQQIVKRAEISCDSGVTGNGLALMLITCSLLLEMLVIAHFLIDVVADLLDLNTIGQHAAGFLLESLHCCDVDGFIKLVDCVGLALQWFVLETPHEEDASCLETNHFPFLLASHYSFKWRTKVKVQ